MQMISYVESLYWILAPNGRQLEQAAKAGKQLLKEAPKFADDVARAVSKNPDFFQSIPTWLWVVLGIVVIGVVIYKYIEDN